MHCFNFNVSSSFFSLQSCTTCVLVVSARIKRPWRSPSCAWRVQCMSPRRVSRLRGNLWSITLRRSEIKSEKKFVLTLMRTHFHGHRFASVCTNFNYWITSQAEITQYYPSIYHFSLLRVTSIANIILTMWTICPYKKFRRYCFRLHKSDD